MINVDLKEKESIKITGPSYYYECYRLWDLEICKNEFDGELYQRFINLIKNKDSEYYRTGFNKEFSVIHLEKFGKFEIYEHSITRNIRRDIMVGVRKGLYLKEFNLNDFVEDFLEINKSQDINKNGINPWYIQSSDNFKGGYSGGGHKWEDDLHYTKTYGVFENTRKEKLLAYCRVCTDNEIACVTLIFGHYEYLKYGLMFFLLINIVKILFSENKIKYFIYYHSDQFEKWKKRMGFEPTFINFNL